jgi:hypothetical protein
VEILLSSDSFNRFLSSNEFKEYVACVTERKKRMRKKKKRFTVTRLVQSRGTISRKKVEKLEPLPVIPPEVNLRANQPSQSARNNFRKSNSFMSFQIPRTEKATAIAEMKAIVAGTDIPKSTSGDVGLAQTCSSTRKSAELPKPAAPPAETPGEVPNEENPLTPSP